MAPPLGAWGLGGVFEHIGLLGGNPLERARRTSGGNGTFVAIQTAIVTHLKKQRPISKGRTALDALAAAVAEGLVEIVLVVRFFNESALYRPGRAKLVFGAGIERPRGRLMKAGAVITISAYPIDLNALDGGFCQHAMRRAIAARDTYLRVDLPDHIVCAASAGQEAR